MKSKHALVSPQIASQPAPGWLPGRLVRLLVRDGAPSIDGLDIAIRGFGVAIVVLWSLLGYARSTAPFEWEMADPMAVSLGLILYNIIVIAVIGVPWRTSPGFPLFVVDWVVASAAILLTGGFLSPFILLYYALIIGAALRVGLSRSVILAGACSMVFITLSLLHPEPQESIRIPILVVQVASLVMVMFMSAGMKRAVEVEVRKVELEERSARQLRLLNNLTNTVLAGPPDLREILRTASIASREAVKADSGMAVLTQPVEQDRDAETESSALIIVSDRDPDPLGLSLDEQRVIERVMETHAPMILTAGEAGTRRYTGLEHGGANVCVVACVPFLLDERVIGALFVARFEPQTFTQSEVGLLKAISQQMAVAARMARLYEMEREKAERSQQSERLERDLLSVVSHELRTPLTSIKTSVGALKGAATTPDNAGAGRKEAEIRLLNNIGRSTDRLINLVNELLDMARLRAGRVTLNLQELNAGEVLLEAVAGLRPLFEERGQKLQIDLPLTGSPRWYDLAIYADRRRIEQVIVNFLSNAQKYGPRDSNVVVGATPRGGQVRVFVRDEGPGISHDDRGRVFEKFYRAGEGKHEGTGLGLAIARSIVELHKGQIGVTANVGAGSTFYFTMPQRAREELHENHGY